jgi:hypothetical protein
MLMPEGQLFFNAVEHLAHRTLGILSLNRPLLGPVLLLAFQSTTPAQYAPLLQAMVA